MPNASIVSKLLTSQEKRILRNKRVKLAEFFSMEEVEIATLLECDPTRIKEILKVLKPVEEKMTVSHLSSKDNRSGHLPGKWIAAAERVATGFSAAVNRSIGTYEGLAGLTHKRDGEIFERLSNISGVSSSLQLNIDNTNKINGLVNPSTAINQITSLVNPMAELWKLNINLTSKIPASYPGTTEYIEMSKQQPVSNIYQSFKGLDSILSAATQTTAPSGMQNFIDLHKNFSPSIFEPNTSQYITANALQAATTLLPELTSRLGLAITNAVQGSLLETPAYQSLGISALSNNLSTHFKSSEIFGPKIGIAMTNVAMLGNLAENSLSAIKWADLGKIDGISEIAISVVKNDFKQFASNYSSLLHSIDKKPNWVFEAPKLVEISPNAFYTQSRMLELISIDDVDSFITNDVDLELDEHNSASLNHLLHQLNPDLVKIWDGAIYALQGNNPDFIRHFTLSIRELYTHITHALSPEKDFIKWDEKGEHLHLGRPTRQGRLYYINRNLHGSKKEFTKFLNIEVKNTLELMEILNGGTHGINSSLTKPRLKTIKIKAEQLFVSLLQIEFSINRIN
eukprot:GDKJ01021331.1.p1 GENE.GDKJ01021331.1~~GDKJ01021331.1.p1  ORF type:complete len:569 (-),score=24.02 GDKJ01021331.1:129-1835(-)